MIDALSQAHLTLLGGFAINAQDDLPINCGSVLLIGPDEPRFWPEFIRSAEYQDGAPDPMDRWSKRQLNRIAVIHNGHAIFPSDGPPFAPFYSWALRTGLAWASPIGLLVHAQAGLFVSFRGALAVPWDVEFDSIQSPCSSCATKPCQSSCPVGAFSKDGYDVAICKNHLTTPAGLDCMTQGCAARRACPIGQDRRIPDQSAFHMDAFI
ncbi:ferredoxin [Loktanella sp. S4079]|nr:ferredoxin [Loktanella sp. S4079]